MLGNNSCGAHSVQSRVPRARPAASRTTSWSSRSSPTAACGCGRGDERRGATRGSLPRAGRARSTAAARAARPLRATRSAPGYPQIPRRVSGYNLDELLPENGLRSRARARRHGVDVRDDPARRRSQLIPQPPRARCSPSATRTSTQPPTTSRSRSSTSRSAIEGMDDTLIEDMTLIGIHRTSARAAPRRAGLAARRVRRRDEGGGRREGARVDARPREGRPAAVGDEVVRRPRQRGSTSGRCARRGSARRRSSRGRRTREGWEDSAVPPERLGEYLRDLRSSRERYGYERLALRPLRPGLRPRPLELRPGHEAAGSRSSARSLEDATRPRRVARRLALRRARRRPVARGAAAEDVRRRARPARSRSSSRSGIPTGR